MINLVRPEENPMFDKLLALYPFGTKFTIEGAALAMGVTLTEMRKYLSELESTLLDCPEGIQIKRKRGGAFAGGGTWFEEGEC